MPMLLILLHVLVGEGSHIGFGLLVEILEVIVERLEEALTLHGDGSISKAATNVFSHSFGGLGAWVLRDRVNRVPFLQDVDDGIVRLLDITGIDTQAFL